MMVQLKGGAAHPLRCARDLPCASYKSYVDAFLNLDGTLGVMSSRGGAF